MVDETIVINGRKYAPVKCATVKKVAPRTRTLSTQKSKIMAKQIKINLEIYLERNGVAVVKKGKVVLKTKHGAKTYPAWLLSNKAIVVAKRNCFITEAWHKTELI